MLISDDGLLVVMLYNIRLDFLSGHINVLYMGLLGNIIRFLYVSWVRAPWSVLPFELLQGKSNSFTCRYNCLKSPNFFIRLPCAHWLAACVVVHQAGSKDFTVIDIN